MIGALQSWDGGFTFIDVLFMLLGIILLILSLAFFLFSSLVLWLIFRRWLSQRKIKAMVTVTGISKADVRCLLGNPMSFSSSEWEYDNREWVYGFNTPSILDVLDGLLNRNRRFLHIVIGDDGFIQSAYWGEGARRRSCN